jgi:hypothetical protein
MPSVTRIDQQTIRVTVIAAAELDDLVPAGRGPCQPEGAHRRLCAGTDEPQHLDRGHPLAHQRRQFDLAAVWRAETRPLDNRLRHRRDHPLVGVTEDQRSPGAHPVDVLISIRIPYMRACTALEEDRLAADRPERAYGAIDAARQQRLRLSEEHRRFRPCRQSRLYRPLRHQAFPFE